MMEWVLDPIISSLNSNKDGKKLVASRVDQQVSTSQIAKSKNKKVHLKDKNNFQRYNHLDSVCFTVNYFPP